MISKKMALAYLDLFGDMLTNDENLPTKLTVTKLGGPYTEYFTKGWNEGTLNALTKLAMVRKYLEESE
tara:strand:+ start:2579 stop:2782 length:204 start_codon:yes stop_codon:yes gene_type:complete